MHGKLTLSTCLLSVALARPGAARVVAPASPVAAGTLERMKTDGQAAKPELVTTVIQLEHVKPSLMAWWIDPRRQPWPAYLDTLNPDSIARATSDQTRGLPSIKTTPSPMIIRHNEAMWSELVAERRRGYLQLAGVEKISANDAENKLTIHGTAEGCRQVLEEVQGLDFPPRQLRLQIGLFEINRSASTEFFRSYYAKNPESAKHGNDIVTKKTYRGLVQSIVDQQSLTYLQAQVTKGAARELGKGQITTIENLPVIVSLLTKIPSLGAHEESLVVATGLTPFFHGFSDVYLSMQLTNILGSDTIAAMTSQAPRGNDLVRHSASHTPMGIMIRKGETAAITVSTGYDKEIVLMLSTSLESAVPITHLQPGKEPQR